MMSDTRTQWRWLGDTYWYVLPIDLPALNFDPDDTVLPNGSVQVTFVPRLGGTSNATTGLGQMIEIGGAWVFAMQMSTDRLSTRVLHWANMVQTREGDPSWQQLPGLTYSVPEMLDGAVYPHIDAG